MVETGLEKRGLIINKCALLHGYPLLLNIECCLQGNLPVSTRDSTNMPNSNISYLVSSYPHIKGESELVCPHVALESENQFIDMSLHCVATSLVWLILNIREFFTPGRVDEGGGELLNDLQCITYLPQRARSCVTLGEPEDSQL
jgi:hypothetical protein